MKVNNENKIPIKMWVTDIEEGAMSQARNLSNLPYTFKHIALMPDCHQGFGMPIGGVMATKDVVVPNAVGVDIGCFEKNIKVPLLDGSCETLYNLSKRKKKFYVYSLNNKGEIVPGKAKSILTKKKTKVMEVCISSGEVITCTPDHKFMLLNGKYKESKDLKSKDSLMPFYRTYESSDGYEHIKTKTGTSVLTHKKVAKYFLGNKKDSDLIHHKDGNWYNNSPSNLEYKDKGLHSKEHRAEKPIFGTEEFKEKRLKKLKENGFYDKKFTEKKKEVGIQNITKYNKSDKKKEQDKLSGKRGRKYFIRDNKKTFQCEICGKVCQGLGAFSRHKKIHENNHKVLWIKKTNRKIDVYCLQVEKYHNFALQSGIFVHNCGMIAVKTSLKSENFKTEDLKMIMGEIRQDVPVGFKKHNEPPKTIPLILLVDEKDTPICYNENKNALVSLGTLGGGNHFIEIQKGDDGFIWIMIHSGSRNLGLKVATHYNKLAKELNRKWHSGIPEKWDLAFLPLDSEEGKNYIEEMNHCLGFAQSNRDAMMEKVMDIFLEHCNIEFEEPINIHHNFAQIENHFGQNVMVHRKGATSAQKGQLGIIPGSQGTCSYIVEGLGNIESFKSCSHGAGRKMGRKDAQRRLNLEEEQKLLDERGVVHSIRNISDLDEAPGSYKDIAVVMENQKDLVKIITKLSPLGVIKG